MGGGCTSGHGVCGLGRRSPQSLVTTLTFMTLGIINIHHAKRDGRSSMKAWPALISGVLFGLGLTLSGMSDPSTVLGFLNITGAWIPDLIFVIAGAMVVTFLVTPLFTSREVLLLPSTFSLPGK